MAISSQALQECIEGSTTRADGPERTMEPHERAATKMCKVCKKTLPVTDFYGGMRRRCKKCICAAIKTRYKDPEVRAQGVAKCARYYKENRESLLAQKSQYGKIEKVADRDKSRRRQRYATDDSFRTKTKIRRDRYYASKPHVFRARDAKRRAGLMMATPIWANAEAIRNLYKIAAMMSCKTGIEYEVDHIIPLKGRTVCGLHVEGNLRVIKMIDNRRKLNKLVDDIV